MPTTDTLRKRRAALRDRIAAQGSHPELVCELAEVGVELCQRSGQQIPRWATRARIPMHGTVERCGRREG